MDLQPECDYLWKVILVGDSGVGKTNLLSRFTHDKFNQDTTPTIGLDFATSKQQLDDGQTVMLQIWDSAGQEKFRTITRSFYRGIVGALLVYDITRKETFDHVEGWLRDLRENSPDEVTVVLVGNKADREQDRAVTAEEVDNVTEQTGLIHMETSALNSNNVAKAFDLLVQEINEKQKTLAPKRRAEGQLRLARTYQSARRHSCC